VKPVAKITSVKPKTGTLEFRIRPYATVYLDGKPLGQTPLRSVSVPAGKHHIRMVNEKLAKDVKVEFVVKANDENVFKYNLKD
jgi:eukaryotic-like serine/threonine-protein kinase